MKKTINTLICTLLIISTIIINLSVCIPTISADSSDGKVIDENLLITMKSDAEQVKAGDKIEVAVNMELLNGNQANGMVGVITYDPSILEFDTDEEFIVNRTTRWEYPSYTHDDGELIFLTKRDRNADVSGEVFYIVFNVLQDAEQVEIGLIDINCSYDMTNLWVEDIVLKVPETPVTPPDPPEPPDPPTPPDPPEPPVDGEELYLQSQAYEIGDNDIRNYENGDAYISKVVRETTKAAYVQNLATNGTIRVLKHDGTELQDNELVGTGMTLEVTKGNQQIVLKIAVMGDLDGNGKVTVTDLSTMNKTLVGKITLEGEYAIAADLDDNTRITPTDLSMINRILVGRL